MSQKVNILIVEENDTLAEPLAEMLGSVGYTVSGIATDSRSVADLIQTENDDLFVPVVRGYVRIRTSEILFILSDSNYCKVYLSPEGLESTLPGQPNTYLHVSVPMGALYRKLPPVFYKLSRFEVINLRKIDRIGKQHLLLGGHEREIPENGRASLLKHLRVVKRK